MYTSKKIGLSLATAVVASTLTVIGGGSASAGTIFDNCTAYNSRYPHGVGRRYAHDRTTSGDPVTNFLRSNRKFRRAMNHNTDLDRDGDKVACEKH